MLEGDRRFVTAVRLTFASRVVVFRAVPDNDTLAAVEIEAFHAPDEVWVTISADTPWTACIGRKGVAAGSSRRTSGPATIPLGWRPVAVDVAAGSGVADQPHQPTRTVRK
jgi:hypothetical protein